METAEDLRRTERRIPMSYEEYLHRFDDNKFVEWVDGEAVVFPLPTTRHQIVLGFLRSLLSSYVSIYHLGEVFLGPLEMKLSPSGSARTPDILFVSTENQDRVDERRINGAADLVVEIVDTESVSRDRGEKFYDYQANSVREYWIIDPRLHSARADFWVLDTSGRYLAAVPGDNGIYISTVLPNFSLKVDMFDQNELPGYVDALIDIIGMDAFLNALELT